MQIDVRNIYIYILTILEIYQNGIDINRGPPIDYYITILILFYSFSGGGFPQWQSPSESYNASR